MIDVEAVLKLIEDYTNHRIGEEMADRVGWPNEAAAAEAKAKAILAEIRKHLEER